MGSKIKLGSISGRYFEDTNGDGLDNNESPVIGFGVKLFDTESNKIVKVTLTDHQGNYSFTDIPPGKYTVLFDGPTDGREFTFGNVGSDNTIDSDVADINSDGVGSTGVIHLPAGHIVKDVDAGIVEKQTLTPGSLSGRYFCDENGNNQDDFEPGIEGILVELLDALGHPTGVTTTTDVNGEYHFNGLTPDIYCVRFTDTNPDHTLVDPNVGSDATDSDAIDQGNGVSIIYDIHVVSGQNTPDNDAGITKPAEPGSLSGRYFCDENDNNQEDAGEAGVEGVLVELLNANGDPTGATTTTNANGEYSFGDLAEGTYGVRFTDTVSGKVLVDPNVGPDATDSDAIDQGNGVSIIPDIHVISGQNTPNNDVGVEESVPELGSLSGRYFCDENGNNQEDAGEPGIAGVLVELLNANGELIGATATTDSNGEYSFADLPEGTYGVRFMNSGSLKVLVDPNVGPDATDSDAIDQGSGVAIISNIAVVAGQNTPDNDAGAQIPPPGSLSGRYFCDENDNNQEDAGEAGVEGVLVELLNANGDPTGATTTTDANGEYSFGGLIKGIYGVRFTDTVSGKVLVDANVGPDATDSDAIDQGNGVSIIPEIRVVSGQNTPDNDAGVEEPAPSVGVVKGSVFCDLDCDGINDTGIDPLPEQKGVNLLINGDFEQNKVPGNFGSSLGIHNPITAGWKDIGSKSAQIHEQDYGHGNATGDAIVELEKGVCIKQTMNLDNAGKYCLEFDLTRRESSDQNNTFELIINGEKTVYVAQGSETISLELDLPAGNNSIVFNSLSHSHTGAGIDDVSLREIIPAELADTSKVDVTVELLDTNGDVVTTTTTDSNGQYQFDDVIEGDYQVRFIAPDGQVFTEQNIGSDDLDSDVDANGASDVFSVTVDSTTTIDAGLKEDVPVKEDEEVHLNFDQFSRGTVITDQIDGVTVSAKGGSGKAMIFDTDRPTGGDSDLAHNGRGKVLIISEDGDRRDPDDNWRGGTLRFDFDNAKRIDQLTVIDTEEGGIIHLYNVDGQLINTVTIPRIDDGDIRAVSINTNDVAIMDVVLHGSGAIDDIKYLKSPIVLDLNGDGEISVTGETSSRDKDANADLGETVVFDIDADGDLDTIEWVDGSGDGILIDTDKIDVDGYIDGAALFGDQGGKYTDGYAKLAGQDSNNDGIISDSELGNLGIWIDDGDAVLEEGELQTVTDAGIASISTNMEIVYDDNGRALMQSVATTTEGEDILTEDVWFAEADEDLSVIEADTVVMDAEAYHGFIDSSDTL